MRLNQEQRVVHCENGDILYLLTRKPVKNVNLRIKPKGEVRVSANNSVPIECIDAFIEKKQRYIFLKVKDKDDFRHKEIMMLKWLKQYQMTVFEGLLQEKYLLFENMVWHILHWKSDIWHLNGACQPKKGNHFFE